ncbi:hypothetical protein CLJ1_3671 [Pseudomonas paraeruginosa]|nr:hypothetical protein CLJ1_3671 [Pseudomonas aeruginosa]
MPAVRLDRAQERRWLMAILFVVPGWSWRNDAVYPAWTCF